MKKRILAVIPMIFVLTGCSLISGEEVSVRKNSPQAHLATLPPPVEAPITNSGIQLLPGERQNVQVNYSGVGTSPQNTPVSAPSYNNAAQNNENQTEDAESETEQVDEQTTNEEGTEQSSEEQPFGPPIVASNEQAAQTPASTTPATNSTTTQQASTPASTTTVQTTTTTQPANTSTLVAPVVYATGPDKILFGNSIIQYTASQITFEANSLRNGRIIKGKESGQYTVVVCSNDEVTTSSPIGDFPFALEENGVYEKGQGSSADLTNYNVVTTYGSFTASNNTSRYAVYTVTLFPKSGVADQSKYIFHFLYGVKNGNAVRISKHIYETMLQNIYNIVGEANFLQSFDKTTTDLSKIVS